MPEIKNMAVLVDIAMNEEREKVAGVIKDLVCDREYLIACLKQIDTECTFCKHNQKPAPCGEINSALECDTCILYCVCKDCVGNSKWEWKG